MTWPVIKAAGQKSDQLRDVLGRAEPPQRGLLGQRSLFLCGKARHHVRFDHAGRDAVDADAGRAKLLGERAAQRDDCALGRGIRRLAARAVYAPDRACQDNASRFLVDHSADRLAAAVKGAVHVDGEQPPPALGRHVGQKSVFAHAGAADQKPHRTGLLKHGFHLRRVGHVGLYGPAADLRGQRLGLFPAGAVVDPDLPAVRGKPPGSGGAYPAGRAAYQCFFIHVDHPETIVTHPAA